MSPLQLEDIRSAVKALAAKGHRHITIQLVKRVLPDKAKPRVIKEAMRKLIHEGLVQHTLDESPNGMVWSIRNRPLTV